MFFFTLLVFVGAIFGAAKVAGEADEQSDFYDKKKTEKDSEGGD